MLKSDILTYILRKFFLVEEKWRTPNSFLCKSVQETIGLTSPIYCKAMISLWSTIGSVLPRIPALTFKAFRTQTFPPQLPFKLALAGTRSTSIIFALLPNKYRAYSKTRPTSQSRSSSRTQSSIPTKRSTSLTTSKRTATLSSARPSNPRWRSSLLTILFQLITVTGPSRASPRTLWLS